jgi:hypothetical protein
VPKSLWGVPAQADVSYWHETDMPAAVRDVRSQGQSGKHILAVSFSGFDLEQKSEIKIVRIADTCTSLESGVRSSILFGLATTPFKPLGGVTSVNWVDTAYVSW